MHVALKSFKFSKNNKTINFRYDENGNTQGKVDVIPPAPTRLQWDFQNEQLLKTIDEAYNDAQKLLNVRSTNSLCNKIKLNYLFHFVGRQSSYSGA